MSVQDIELAMQSLSIDELAQVRDKAVALYQARWDAQLVIDMESGRLDAWLDEDKQEKRKEAARRA
ncbi:hypothetical protein [Fibrella arboris]|uniref:hypothetical protein n=1 Tax=Fibrella arboris TaxID=3242486 RepID=UPI003521F0CA